MDRERPRPNLSFLIPPATPRPSRARGPAQILTILTPPRVDDLVSIVTRTLVRRDEHCAACEVKLSGRQLPGERIQAEAAARADARRLVERLLDAVQSPIAVTKPRRPRPEPLPPLAS